MMRHFTVTMQLSIKQRDIDALKDMGDGWTVESEIKSWLSDLGFIIDDLIVSERGE